MFHLTVDTIIGVMLGATLRFITRQILVVNADYFLGPLVTLFWRHAKAFVYGQHPTRSPLQCDRCQAQLYDLPQ